MGRIIFYEERNFQGRSYDCSSDCSDIHVHLSRCNSCRVESGCFVAYDRPGFTGNQVFLKRGEYSDFQRLGSMMGMMGTPMTDTVRSCRMIPTHRGQFRMKVYERENYGGQAHELTDDCESLQDRYLMSDCRSCSVTDGHWLMFELPGYRGRMLYARPGEYGSFGETGASNVLRVSSVRRIADNC